MMTQIDSAAWRHIDAAIGKLLASVADDIVGDAQIFVPVESGDLHDTIRAEPVSDRHIRVVAGDEDVNYAAHVELGTTRMDPQPYLRPATYRKRGP